MLMIPVQQFLLKSIYLNILFDLYSQHQEQVKIKNQVAIQKILQSNISTNVTLNIQLISQKLFQHEFHSKCHHIHSCDATQTVFKVIVECQNHIHLFASRLASPSSSSPA